MRRFARPSLIVLCALLAAASALTAEARRGKKQTELPVSGVARLVERLPADPVWVMATDVAEMQQSFEGLFELVSKLDEDGFDREEIAQQLAAFGETIGCSLIDELVPSLGPAVALSIDLPPLDGLPVAFAEPTTGVPRALGGIGLLGEVTDAATLERCLHGVIAAAGAEMTVIDGLNRVTVDSPPGSPAIHIWFALRDGLFSLGLAPEFVEDSLAGRAEGERLVDGADYAALFRHLDARPSAASYINLPKILGLIDESVLVQGAIASDEDAAQLMRLVQAPEFIGSGLASTSVRLEGMMRSSTTGPPLLGGGSAASIGIVAAIAVPNLLNAIDRGKQKRTMADLRSIGTTIEEYSIDNNVYPRPTDGWEPVSVLTEFVSPIYIRTMPTVDGWGHRILFRCDGESYRLVSPGKDGLVEGDWSGAFESGKTTRFDADIVFGDGSFMRWPEGTQE